MGSYGYSDDDISRFLQPYLSAAAAQDDELFSPEIKRQKQEETVEEKHEREILEIQAPPKSMTGVSASVVRICAKLSHGIYKANSIKDLQKNLSTDGIPVQVILFDNHGMTKTTTPPFAVAVIPSIQTMVLVWRGSMTKMDWVVDLAVAPVLSERWSHADQSLRAHGGYTALVESDLALHQEFLVNEIEKRGIQQILLTGHSLAGAMAQIAQVAIQGELLSSLSTHKSTWSRLSENKDMLVRSIQFGAPMSCMHLNDNDESDLWNKISQTSCNLVYANDMLPRAPGNFVYVDTAVRKALVPFVRDAFQNVPIMSMLDLFPSALQKLVDLYRDETKKQDVRDIIKLCQKFQHVGSIIWYQSIRDAPVKLDDYQFRTHSRYQYSIPENEPYPNRRLKEDHVKLPDILAHDTPKSK